MKQQDSAWSEILKGKVAVVTGAARGIGRSAAAALAGSGASRAGIDICATVDPRSGVAPATKADLEETGQLVKVAGGRWKSFVVDQRDLAALRATAVQIEHDSCGIDILFANAGIQAFRPLLEMEDPDWHIQIDVNLTGTANAIRAFAPALVRRGSGHKRSKLPVECRRAMCRGMRKMQRRCFRQNHRLECHGLIPRTWRQS